jgi:gluconolactonase
MALGPDGLPLGEHIRIMNTPFRGGFRHLSLSLLAFFVGGSSAFSAEAVPVAAKPSAVLCSRNSSALLGTEPPETLADGFSWTEGPLWLASDETLLFEDMLNNRMCRWKEGEGASVFLEKSGDGKGTSKAWNPGSNGMALGSDGLVYFCQHGDRRIVKMNPATRELVPVVDRYEGKLLNSPNDLVFDAQGNLYFTDPPYGLVKEEDSALGFSGVYRLTPEGVLTLLTKELARPNGIALSPDGRTLYVNDSDEKAFALHAYPLHEDGSIGQGRVLWDAMSFAQDGPGATDGMKVDESGHIWTTGPGGVFVLSPDGEILGRVKIGEPCGNLAFGGKDGRTLFIMANHAVLRIRTTVRGAAR